MTLCFAARAIQDVNPRPYESDPEKGFTMDIMMMMDMDKVTSAHRHLAGATLSLTDEEQARSARFAASSNRRVAACPSRNLSTS